MAKTPKVPNFVNEQLKEVKQVKAEVAKLFNSICKWEEAVQNKVECVKRGVDYYKGQTIKCGNSDQEQMDNFIEQIEKSQRAICEIMGYRSIYELLKNIENLFSIEGYL